MLKRTPPNGKNGKKHNGSGGKNGKKAERVRELPKITTQTDTREILAHAAKEKRDGFANRGRTGVIESWKLHEHSRAWTMAPTRTCQRSIRRKAEIR